MPENRKDNVIRTFRGFIPHSIGWLVKVNNMLYLAYWAILLIEARPGIYIQCNDAFWQSVKPRQSNASAGSAAK
jgi:hypothetical protein